MHSFVSHGGDPTHAPFRLGECWIGLAQRLTENGGEARVREHDLAVHASRVVGVVSRLRTQLNSGTQVCHKLMSYQDLHLNAFPLRLQLAWSVAQER